MMRPWKRVLACALSVVLALSGCGTQPAGSANQATDGQDNETEPVDDEESQESLDFDGLGDERLHQYLQDGVYAQLEDQLGDEYEVESVQAIYVSKEYLDELSYNSQENIYFGYSLSELEQRFQGTKYVFSLGEDGQTTVHEFSQTTDDTFAEVTRNVAIGGGVILICATVSVATAGVAPLVSVVFAVSADTAVQVALSNAFIGGTAATVVTGIETGNLQEALEQGALKASEGFKWGAISGAITGGLSEAGSLYYANSTNDIPTWQESQTRAANKYGGEEQLRFFKGEQVSDAPEGCSIPDVVHQVKNHLEAIEVKNYDLKDRDCYAVLKSVLKRQVRARIENMPEGTTQKIVLDVRGRGYSNKFLREVIQDIQQSLADVYPNIPIDIMV